MIGLMLGSKPLSNHKQVPLQAYWCGRLVQGKIPCKLLSAMKCNAICPEVGGRYLTYMVRMHHYIDFYSRLSRTRRVGILVNLRYLSPLCHVAQRFQAYLIAKDSTWFRQEYENKAGSKFCVVLYSQLVPLGAAEGGKAEKGSKSHGWHYIWSSLSNVGALVVAITVAASAVSRHRVMPGVTGTVADTEFPMIFPRVVASDVPL